MLAVHSASMPHDGPAWLYEFHPYGLFHWVTGLVCLVAILAWIALGRWLLALDKRDDGRREYWFRATLSIAMLLVQAFATAWRFLPGQYDLNESWPVHLCRLVAWVAPIALWTHWRRPRALLYFWGIGLSTQAFFTPMWGFGLASVEFWLYWGGHTFIVGAALYEVFVHGYGPRFRDWGFAALWGLIYAGVTVALNLQLGTNYSYLGRGDYDARSVVDFLGPWPQRAWIMAGLAEGGMLVLYWLSLGVRTLKGRRTKRLANESGVPGTVAA